jgi:hypothetical protein
MFTSVKILLFLTFPNQLFRIKHKSAHTRNKDRIKKAVKKERMK